jgi:hypothetical protein
MIAGRCRLVSLRPDWMDRPAEWQRRTLVGYDAVVAVELATEQSRPEERSWPQSS